MKMKLLTLFLVLGFSLQVLPKEDKVYTQKDYDEKVKVEVERQINIVKKKSITQITKELLEKERELKKRQEQLDKREEQVTLSEKSLLRKIGEFEGVKTKIIGCMDDNKKSEALRIKQLVSVISNMKPLKAAELLSVQESDISVKLLERIDPERASKIFNLMDKEVSARLQKQYLNMQQ